MDEENKFKTPSSGVDRGNMFRQLGTKSFREKLFEGSDTSKIFVCENCFNNKFKKLEGGQIQCTKCNQIYWV